MEGEGERRRKWVETRNPWDYAAKTPVTEAGRLSRAPPCTIRVLSINLVLWLTLSEHRNNAQKFIENGSVLVKIDEASQCLESIG